MSAASPEPFPGAHSPPGTRDHAAMWKYLESGISVIMRDARNGLDVLTYTNMYTVVYNYMTNPWMDWRPPGVPKNPGFMSKGLLVGPVLYDNLQACVAEYARQRTSALQDQEGAQLLGRYLDEWDRYEYATKKLGRVFRFFFRIYVRRQRDEKKGGPGTYDCDTMSAVIWRHEVLREVEPKLTPAILDLFRRQRQGGDVAHAEIGRAVRCSFLLGAENPEISTAALETYQTLFERAFLEDTREFYGAESRELLAEGGALEYLRKAEARLDEEAERRRLCLHAESTGPLRRACHQAFINDHRDAIRDKIESLSDADREAASTLLDAVLAAMPDDPPPSPTEAPTSAKSDA